MNTPVREGETIEGSRTMRNRPYQVLKCSKQLPITTVQKPQKQDRATLRRSLLINARRSGTVHEIQS